MRNNLDGFAEISAFALLGDDCVVDFTRRDIVGFRSVNSKEALIMSEVKICFSTILSYITLSVLIGIECSRVDVDVGVKFLDGNSEASRLQEFRKGGGNDSFA